MKKTKVIVVNDETLSPANFGLLLNAIKIQLDEHVSVSTIKMQEIGWLGRDLRTAVDEGFDDLLIVPSTMTVVDLPYIQSSAESANCQVVIRTKPTNLFTQEFEKFYSAADYFCYVDLNFFRENSITIDWGGPCWLEQFIDYPFVNDVNNVISRRDVNNTVLPSSNRFGPGWILLIQTLNAGGNILKIPIGLIDKSFLLDYINAAPTDQSLTLIKQAAIEWRAMLTDKFSNRLKSKTTYSIDSIRTNFANASTPVENLYCCADNFGVFLSDICYAREFRLIFIDYNDANLTAAKLIIDHWDGTNHNALEISTQLKQQLSAISTKWGETFDSVWSKVTGNYVVYFNLNDPAFYEDYESQAHVNNLVFLGALSDFKTYFTLDSFEHHSREIWTRLEDRYSVAETVTDAVYQEDQFRYFNICYRNTQTGETLDTLHEIKPHLTAQKWARCLYYDYLVDETNLVEKNYMLQHWEYASGNPNARDIPALCREMNRYVDIINAYFDGSTSERPRYEITQYFDPATLDQQILNEIHHHFELLIGQVWSVSEWFKLADVPTAFAIRQLNNLCHEMEGNRRESFRNSKTWWSGIYFPFMHVKRYKFVESDYDHFSQINYFGDVVLHYCQLGKTPIEAFSADDGEVFDDNITGLRYVGGEFDVIFRTDRTAEQQIIDNNKLNSRAFPWIRSRGQDPESKFTGVGYITVASFDRAQPQFAGLTAEQCMEILVQYDDIYKIELLDRNKNVVKSSTLDYTWLDVLDKTDPTRQ